MLVTDIFRLATRMFRTNRSRTILTILGISVGIGAILFLVSLGYGLQRLILNKITTSDALLSLDVSSGDLTALKLDQQALDKIKSINGVDITSPMVSAQAQMIIDDISSELTANFVDNEFFRLDGTALKKGAFYKDTPEDGNKVIISSSALKLFNLDEDQAFNKEINFSILVPSTEDEEKIIKDYTQLDGKFKIIGIVDDEESNFVYMPISISQKLEINSFSKIKVKVTLDSVLPLVRTAISDQGFVVSALSDTIEQANQIFKIVQIVLASFGIIALIVSAIGMFNTMTIALLERTQEIGIMKALGATSIDIWNMFLAESVIIGFFGGLGGILIGMLTGELFNYLVNVLASAFGGQKIDMFYTPLWFILLIIFFSTFVGLITGFYPAQRAAKINCLEALRYK